MDGPDNFQKVIWPTGTRVKCFDLGSTYHGKTGTIVSGDGMGLYKIRFDDENFLLTENWPYWKLETLAR